MPQEPHNRVNESQQEALLPPSSIEFETIDFSVLWDGLRAGRRTILISSVSSLILATVISFLIPNSYTATSSFLVPHSAGNGISSVEAQLTMMGIGGLGASLRSPTDMYIGILKSKTIARDMISRFDLKHVYHLKRDSATERSLAAQSDFEAGPKDDIIRISVTDHDPKRACDMANAYLDELHAANGRLALTQSSQRRLFFEQQMAQQKNALENAEAALRKTQEQTGLIAPAPQTSLEIQGIAQTRANIEAREVQLAGLLQGSTEYDPTIIRLRSEVAGLKGQLARMINGGGTEQSGIPTSKVPSLQLEYLRKQREVTYQETLYDILARQYEAARLDESHDAPVLQIVDQAVIPDTKTGPHCTLIMLGGLLIGVFASTAWLLLRLRLASGFSHSL